jgi:hypothetical protein
VGPCHHGIAHRQVEDGGDGLQIWRAAMNIMYKSTGQPKRGDPPTWFVGGEGLAMLTVKQNKLRNITQGLGMDLKEM